MADELIKQEDIGTDVSNFDEDAFAALTKTGNYLPRLQLMIAQSGVCKEGKFPVNHYSLVRGSVNQDLGEEVDVLVIDWRPKALDMSGDQILSVYDPTDPVFGRIQEDAGMKDSGCMFGPEYLVYIPATKDFATYFMGSATARQEAANVSSKLMGKKDSEGNPATGMATFKSHLIKSKKYSWQGPIIIACSTPFDFPTIESIKEQVIKFKNPEKNDIEEAEEETRAT